jgi:hypothetical protein
MGTEVAIAVIEVCRIDSAFSDTTSSSATFEASAPTTKLHPQLSKQFYEDLQIEYLLPLLCRVFTTTFRTHVWPKLLSYSDGDERGVYIKPQLKKLLYN